jgi:tetratricopeptide (TPR) repeat protein
MDIHQLIQSKYHDIDGIDDFDKVLEDITDPIELAEIYYKLAYTYCRTYGDLEQSDFFYNKALEIFEEKGLRKRYIMTLRDIYVNNELRGEYDIAMTGFESCLEMSKEIDYDLGIIHAAGGIVLLHFHFDDIQNPKIADLLDEFKLLAEKLDTDLLREGVLIVTALILINESRLKHQMKGQELLEGLIDSNFPVVKGSARQFLLISYLEEMIRTNNKELLIQSKQLMDKIKPSMESSLIQKFRFTILESKLHMVDGDFEKTKELLEGLLDEITNLGEKRFIRFIDEIKAELENLNEEYNRWRKLIANNASFKEILDQSAMRQYIIKAQNALINRVE